MIVNCKHRNKVDTMPPPKNTMPTLYRLATEPSDRLGNGGGTATTRHFGTRDLTGCLLSMRCALEIEGVFCVWGRRRGVHEVRLPLGCKLCRPMQHNFGGH